MLFDYFPLGTTTHTARNKRLCGLLILDGLFLFLLSSVRFLPCSFLCHVLSLKLRVAKLQLGSFRCHRHACHRNADNHGLISPYQPTF